MLLSLKYGEFDLKLLNNNIPLPTKVTLQRPNFAKNMYRTQMSKLFSFKQGSSSYFDRMSCRCTLLNTKLIVTVFTYDIKVLSMLTDEMKYLDAVFAINKHSSNHSNLISKFSIMDNMTTPFKAEL